MNWTKFRDFFRDARIPIVADLRGASWPNWREGLKEVIVTLFFSLMPLWLGLLIVKILSITDSVSAFVTKFASSSDLGILSASLLGPMLYMMFREDELRENRTIPGFPSGLWFIMVTVACCIVATVIYCFSYVSGLHAYFDESGKSISFVKAETISVTSWTLFAVVVILLLCACTIRNSVETQPPRMMSEETQEYVKDLQAAQGDQEFVEQLRAAQGGNQ
jgi:hypothetical protein